MTTLTVIINEKTAKGKDLIAKLRSSPEVSVRLVKSSDAKRKTKLTEANEASLASVNLVLRFASEDLTSLTETSGDDRNLAIRSLPFAVFSLIITVNVVMPQIY